MRGSHLGLRADAHAFRRIRGLLALQSTVGVVDIRCSRADDTWLHESEVAVGASLHAADLGRTDQLASFAASAGTDN
jgi:hypothetical protein